MRVLVIGAGPIGLMTALEFAVNGVNVDIVDKIKAPSELSKAVGVMPQTIEKLMKSGIGEKIINEGMPLTKIKIYRNNSVLGHIRYIGSDFARDVMFGLPQARTEALMREALAQRGVAVQFATCVQDITTDEAKAVVTFSNNNVKTYDWVVAADGIHSTAREKLQIPYNGIDLEGQWSIADVYLKGGYNCDTVTARIQSGESGDKATVILPIEEKRVRIVSTTPNALEALPMCLNIDRVNRESRFDISIRQAETYTRGRVLLAGDAAHCHSPVGGKGMNLGVCDAYEAVHAILNNTIDKYSEKQHKLGRQVIRRSELMRKLFCSSNPLKKWFVNLALDWVQRSKNSQKKFFSEMSNLI